MSIVKIYKLIKDLLKELSVNGKLLIGYIITQIPDLTAYPGLKSAVEAFLSNPDKQNLIKLAFELFLAGAAGHRILKIVIKVLAKKYR